MAIALAKDFKEFLKSLNSNSVEYLIIGGYAAGVYGYVRATNDLDVWVNMSPDLFLTPNNIVSHGAASASDRDSHLDFRCRV